MFKIPFFGQTLTRAKADWVNIFRLRYAPSVGSYLFTNRASAWSYVLVSKIFLNENKPALLNALCQRGTKSQRQGASTWGIEALRMQTA